MSDSKAVGSKAAGEKQFREEVFPSELAYVRQRWQTLYARRRAKKVLRDRERRLNRARAKAGEGERPEARPTAAAGLVGLAFSGGGIRSATTNLGIAQALHKRGVLDHVDYLSTVSGGGYLGSSLSTVMRDGAEFPFEQRDGPEESPYLSWLRNHSNYLAERGFLDYARIAAVLVRGILVNFLVVVPALLLLSLGLAAWFQHLKVGFFDGENWGELYIGARFTLALSLIYVMTFPVVTWVFKILGKGGARGPGRESTVKLRDRFERSFSALFLLVAGFALVESLPVLLYYFHQAEDRGLWRTVIAGLASGSSIIALTVVGKLMEHFKGLVKTLLMWAVGLLGLLLPLVLVLYVAEGLIWQWPAEQLYEPHFGWPWQGTSYFARFVLAIFVGLSLGGVLAAAVARLLERARGWVRSLAVSSASLSGFGLSLAAVPFAFGPSHDPMAYVAILAGAIALFSWLCVDVNLTSIHGFYRDRLASAYLVGVDQDTRHGARLEEIVLDQIDIEEDLDLQDICQGSREGESPSIAPYHLINVAHNLQGSRDPGIRERQSDFFVFSKSFYGGSRTGYCRTEMLEAVSPEMDLATAMAISAAAAAPNMGGGTVGTLVALMTLLNIRLGYWLPNPRHLAGWSERQDDPLESTLWRRYWWRVRPTALVQEIFSRLDETSRWINLSDGGHIENLAVYELLRRRCRFIVCGDAEADPAIRFGSLAKLQRFARIDLGIEIETHLDDVRQNEDGLSRSHCALGRIRYPAADGRPEEEGLLLYVKSTVTGDEDEAIREYRARKPLFPHESTADQFFDESQFEAYRSLGFHAVEGLFDHDHRIRSFAELEHWFRDLEQNLSPSVAAEELFATFREELASIQGLLREPRHTAAFYHLYPKLAPEGFAPPDLSPEEAAEQRRHNLVLVGEQLRLMESVFVALRLDHVRNRSLEANRVWMRLFQRWAAAWREVPYFLEAYQAEIAVHSPRLKELCADELGMPDSWNNVPSST